MSRLIPPMNTRAMLNPSECSLSLHAATHLTAYSARNLTYHAFVSFYAFGWEYQLARREINADASPGTTPLAGTGVQRVTPRPSRPMPGKGRLVQKMTGDQGRPGASTNYAPNHTHWG